MICAIVAVDKDWGIGYHGELLERIPEDLKNFKRLTSGHTVVMGSKTWYSLPRKPLPNRTNIIISRKGNSILEKNVIRMDLDTFLCGEGKYEDDIFVIGGGEIYKQLLPYCDKAYVTKIRKAHDNIDTYFPNLDENNQWVLANGSKIYTYDNIPYQFCEYIRKS